MKRLIPKSFYDLYYKFYYKFNHLEENRIQKKLYKKNDAKSTFTHIYKNKKWLFDVNKSLSGPGAELEQTRAITNFLPVIFLKYNITSIYDIPCGDFNWMKEVELSKIDYTGGDIVDELIESNTKKHSFKNINFIKINILESSTLIDLKKKDLLLCRDCLIHFSNKDVLKALNNICKSQCKYLLASTYPGARKNKNIVTGMWRPINLTLKPFSLPEPLEIIDEKDQECSSKYPRKHIALWDIKEIKKIL
ncbi:MAG: class I SAM-dependent methyltransferase [Lentisphaerae bacterium]|nr:class I SAM-dependent methyltransferase [Lentisphaerota bacterium]